jgi:hypothetical protein
VFVEAAHAAHVATAAYQLQVQNSPRAGAPLTINGVQHQVLEVETQGVVTGIGWLGDFSGPGFILLRGDTLYVAYRGSNSAEDWVMNAQAHLERVNVGQTLGYAHAGFAHIWSRSNLPHRAAQLANNRRVVFTGHSLGGAIAQLAALEFALITGRTPDVYTFGSPRVGDTSLRDWIRQRLNHFRFKHDNDVVPEVPIWGSRRETIVDAILPRRYPYAHASDVAVRLLDTPTQFVCIANWGPTGVDGLSDHSMEGYISRLNAML